MHGDTGTGGDTGTTGPPRRQLALSGSAPPRGNAAEELVGRINTAPEELLKVTRNWCKIHKFGGTFQNLQAKGPIRQLGKEKINHQVSGVKLNSRGKKPLSLLPSRSKTP